MDNKHTKKIYDLKLAQQLLEEGHAIVGLEKTRRKRVTFIFANPNNVIDDYLNNRRN